ITYTLTYTAGAGGTLTGLTTQAVNYGANGTAVTAVPNTGYHFVNWSDGSTANPRTDTNVTANITVIVNFAINTYTLTYTAGTGGTLTGDTTQTVNYGGSGTPVTAVPNTGYHFVKWSDGSTVNPRTDTNVTANITVSANFAINTYTLTVNQSENGSITPVTATYAYGTEVELIATPALGYHFVEWTGDCSGETSATCVLTMDADKEVSATFAIESCSVVKLINDINQANTDEDLTVINLESGCTYIINEPINDPSYGLVGLPVITTPIKFESVGDIAIITYGSDTTFPLIIVTGDGELTLKNVIIGGSGNIGESNNLESGDNLYRGILIPDQNSEITFMNVVFGMLDIVDIIDYLAVHELTLLNVEDGISSTAMILLLLSR
ncbi:MAG: InlB B-repeat-containing protein, partial [Anaerolineaceae bacterium]|nr:InlB B-repeat-containing protein [Anaerolineaceae bacterium]